MVLFWILLGIIGFLPFQILSQDPNQEVYIHSLSQSSYAKTIWTATPSKRIFKEDLAPATVKDEIKVYCAKNEFEPFQVILKPKLSGTTSITLPKFHNDIEVIAYVVEYIDIQQRTDNLGKTGSYPDALFPIEEGDQVSFVAGQNTAFWIEVHVPFDFDVSSGNELVSNIVISGISVPVRLHIFNFNIPKEIHVKSQMNFGYQTILSKYSVSGTGDDYWKYVNLIKKFFIDHRLTPKSALWPAGVSCCTDYDCSTHAISDPYGVWGFEDQSTKWIKDGSQEYDGRVFPSYMFYTFQNNDPSSEQRPSSFCSVSRSSSDFLGSRTTPYNSVWFEYFSYVQTYLENLGYIDKAYYYAWNEPQNQADYDAIAWYSQEMKIAAPNIKLMVSEEPRSEIYNHQTYTGAKIDIWLPVLNNYDEEESWDREINHGEESWIYFLHGTRPPFFNPITLDKPGIESKLTGWFLWKYRVKGIAYYSLNSWSKNPWTDPIQSGHNGDLFMFYPPSKDNSNIAYGSNNHRLVPSIRFELMRDSLEDYEYLWLLNGNQDPSLPKPSNNQVDQLVDKMIKSRTSYDRDNEFSYNLRRVIGLYLGGEITSIPEISSIPHHQRAYGEPKSYFINFQDPNGNPTMNPLIVDGNEYIKVGWEQFSWVKGYGWYGWLEQAKTQFTSGAPNDLQNSILYCDYGRQKNFQFSLPNGKYNVEVSVGWNGRSYLKNKITVNGVKYVDGESNAGGFLVRTHEITVTDNMISMDMGIFDEYTMLNYMKIEYTGEPGIIINYPFYPEYSQLTSEYTSPFPISAIITTIVFIIIFVIVFGLIIGLLVFFAFIKFKEEAIPVKKNKNPKKNKKETQKKDKKKKNKGKSDQEKNPKSKKKKQKKGFFSKK